MSNIERLQKEMGAKILPPKKATPQKVYYEVAIINDKGTIESRNFAKLDQAKAYHKESLEKGFNVQPIAKYKGDNFLYEIF